MPYTIQGVELLIKHNYYRPTLLSILLSILIAIAFIIICVLCVYHFLDDGFRVAIFSVSLLISVIFLFCCTRPINKYLSTHYATEYSVTISDEVPLQTLLSHYEIVLQDGKIYTLKEKTNDK